MMGINIINVGRVKVALSRIEINFSCILTNIHREFFIFILTGKLRVSLKKSTV